ncbi:hypothetical protein [Mesorhizobium sp. AR02]|nr:hypothetical protein [Mesorhizobium sp. AR02]
MDGRKFGEGMVDGHCQHDLFRHSFVSLPSGQKLTLADISRFARRWTIRTFINGTEDETVRSVLNKGANEMIRKIAIATALISQFTMSAFGATEQWWVAKDAVSKQCEVVTKKPDGTLVIDLAKTTYKSEAEANAAMKKMPRCKK